MSETGALVRAFRTRRRLSQSRLADKAGFDRSYISRLESGGRTATRKTLTRLAHVLALEPDERSRLLMSAGFYPASPAGQSTVLSDVIAERARQHRRWGVQHHSWPEWMSILAEEVGEAAQAANYVQWDGASIEQLREELVQVAAVAVQMVEAIDRDADVVAERHAA